MAAARGPAAPRRTATSAAAAAAEPPPPQARLWAAPPAARPPLAARSRAPPHSLSGADDWLVLRVGRGRAAQRPQSVSQSVVSRAARSGLQLSRCARKRPELDQFTIAALLITTAGKKLDLPAFVLPQPEL